MALIAEEVVEEWLNRQGFFTIRGIKLGNHEIDILAIRPKRRGKPECRHVEVQVSTRPIGYISQLPLGNRGAGERAGGARRRARKELREGVEQWVARKFDLTTKVALKKQLCSGKWTRELVVHNVRHADELIELKAAGIKITRFSQVVQDLQRNRYEVASAAGRDLLELMLIGHQQSD